VRFDAPTADELPLVYDAWASSYRKSPFAGCVRNCDWDAVSRGTIGEILDRPARVIVGVLDLPDGTRRVAAYSVSEPAFGCLHWLYVKRNFRGQGLGRQLLAHTTSDWAAARRVYTHRTNASQRFLGPTWKWDDSLARVKR
jgi:GNAT superfamily N-acetyltransferase